MNNKKDGGVGVACGDELIRGVTYDKELIRGVTYDFDATSYNSEQNEVQVCGETELGLAMLEDLEELLTMLKEEENGKRCGGYFDNTQDYEEPRVSQSSIVCCANKQDTMTTTVTNSKPYLDVSIATGELPNGALSVYQISRPAVESQNREPEAKLYRATPRKVDEFLVKAAPEVEEIVEEIIENLMIRSYNQQLYLWSNSPCKYKLLDGHKAQHLVSQFCDKAYPHSPICASLIDLAKKGLLYSYKIAVYDKKPLPAVIWPFCDGLVNIVTGEYMLNPETFFFTEGLKAKYDVSATCPLFDEFLHVAMNGNTGAVECIWRIIGYILSSDTTAKKFFVFLGPGNTGKSLLARIIAGLLDDNSVRAMSVNELGTKFAISELVDKKLATCMDLSKDYLTPAAVGMVKSVTGGDKIRAEEKYKSAITTDITAKLLFGTNFPLLMKELDSAFADRQILVKFENQVPHENQDRELDKKILKEVDGITRKAAEAYLRLVNSGYNFFDKKTPELLPKEIDHPKIIERFAAEKCDLSDTEIRTTTVELHKAYVEFMMELGLPPLDKNPFSALFAKTVPGHGPTKINSNDRGYVGIQLK